MNCEKISFLLEEKRYKELKEVLESIHSVDMAEILEHLEDKEMLILFRLLEKDVAAETFSEMNQDTRTKLLSALTDSEIREVIDEMYLDDVADFLQEMPANVVDHLLLETKEEKRKQINMLLRYPEESAGSIMTVEYIGFHKEMTIEEAIRKVRQVGLNRETIYTCYVLDQRKLIGVVSLRELLTTGDMRTVEEIMETNVIYAYTYDDQEEVAALINRYGLIAVPVVDQEMRMVGIVTIDDALDVLQEEITEDINMMAGIVPDNEDSYFETSVWQHTKSRIPWLLFLMLSATLSGLVLGYFESAILAMPVLNTFVTMLTGTGGNCGSQSSTLMIRGIAVEEIRFRDLPRVLFKELRVAVLVGCALSVVNGIRILVMYQNPILAFTLGITLFFTVILSKTIGCTLPLLAKKIGLDPALMAAPLITTLVDTGTILIYFLIATKIFGI